MGKSFSMNPGLLGSVAILVLGVLFLVGVVSLELVIGIALVIWGVVGVAKNM